ncbi:hypothetical protein QTG54_010924 [Skeletonema marinoi]|uniref:Uncharacterized protein n=1 Tax=Skeletonema marinoi TaxID=267567 RepID=A0AAD9DA42_9STRA|nr:hypothetical protein QTG54_010924 [Skeletonema marinoi]
MAAYGLLLLITMLISSISAFSIKIVGLPGGKVESLPGMYVNSFRRWIAEEEEQSNNNDDNGEMNSCASNTIKIEPIAGAGISIDEGWVNPTSTADLFWPLDVKLQARPALNVMFKQGVLSYASPGLDVRVPHNDGSWRNYGMNSQPIARQWTSLEIAMEQMFHIESFILHKESTADDIKHTTLFDSMDIKNSMQKVATFIGEIDPLSPLNSGFHIVSFPLIDRFSDLPCPELTEDENEEIYKIVMLGTSEPFGSKLLDMDEDILTMSSTSALEVVVARTVKGKDSEYLPEPYKPLYIG